ncbi:hypothetical protein JGH11_10925 [Dysgonomonas sp. Marseille-P4677]|uniref:hypothetical protein n=1 Tax=Dysgonomonas sp. Marseille-P4677 TaxID=2364790 RepID=UPI0019131797|nr:hypothetical protein [Dysgonomonas sp. Marseille-P4677]MBK5721386.1 hypothetical protein [Dysgonomonas sp. Marseille-P4677]
MYEKVKKICSHPIGSSVIGSVIFTILITLVSLLFNIITTPVPLWLCLASILGTFIITVLSIHFSKKEKAKRAESQRIERHNKLMDRQEKERANLILACLNNEDFKKLSKLYNSTKIERFGKQARIVSDSEYNYYYPTIEKTYTPTTEYNIKFQNISTDRYADKIIYTFSNKYFYSILENYVNTGEKKGIEI